MIELRHERERRGWTLDDVADRTRIPRRYLEALEDGNHEVLPPGPFLRGYLRQYLEFLGQDPAAPTGSPSAEGGAKSDDVHLDEDGDYPDPTPPRTEVPLIRLVVTGFVITLVIVLSLQLGERLITPSSMAVAPAAGGSAPIGPPQKVRIHAGEDVNIQVTSDGEVAFAGKIPATETKEFESNRRIAVDIGDLRWVTIHYNGERIEPLGNLSKKRRIVFIHDGME